jgi:hypothetical protein
MTEEIKLNHMVIGGDDMRDQEWHDKDFVYRNKKRKEILESCNCLPCIANRKNVESNRRPYRR